MRTFFNKACDYDFLEALNIDNNKINALQFLHGNCQYMSLAIAEKLQCNICLWFDYDENIDQYALCHAFNILNINNQQYYVDVRGITTDINNITNEFDYWEKPKIEKISIHQAKQILKYNNIDFDDINIQKIANIVSDYLIQS